MFAVKVNDIVKDVVIHMYPCGEIRKRGGKGKYGQVHWYNFDTYKQALIEAKKWEARGYELKHCKHCLSRY